MNFEKKKKKFYSHPLTCDSPCSSITLAIDPPVVDNKRASITAPLGVAIKHSVFPVLPVNGMTAHHAGKVYLCNLGIPERFYVDAGIQYRSPFGHKFVIPIHPLTAAERGAAAAGAASL